MKKEKMGGKTKQREGEREREEKRGRERKRKRTQKRMKGICKKRIFKNETKVQFYS
jgi:hypothetical protein